MITVAKTYSTIRGAGSNLLCTLRTIQQHVRCTSQDTPTCRNRQTELPYVKCYLYRGVKLETV